MLTNQIEDDGYKESDEAVRFYFMINIIDNIGSR